MTSMPTPPSCCQFGEGQQSYDNLLFGERQYIQVQTPIFKEKFDDAGSWCLRIVNTNYLKPQCALIFSFTFRERMPEKKL